MKPIVFLLCLLSLPLSAATLPPMPPGFVVPLHSPKYAAHLESLGSPMIKTMLAVGGTAQLIAMPPFKLVWDYPADQITNVVFEIWHSLAPTNGPVLTSYDQIPSGFSLLSVVDVPPVFIGGQAQEFFIVRARDRVSGVVSNWNVP